MTEEQKRNKELCELFPFLLPRNVFTDKIPENYDYSYTLADYCLPDGWNKLFLQCCKDIREQLIKDNSLDEFRFSQIKEKYNRMCLYNFGCSQETHDIIQKYEYVSQFICQKCGAPAKYETQGWIASYCENCIEDIANKKYCDPIEFNPIMTIHGYAKGQEYIKELDCSDIWNRLYSNESSL